MSNRKSNVIKSFNYDSSRMDLGVQFKNGKEYIFTPVSPKVAEEFKNSESKGKYFNDYIKSNVAFTCLKIVS